jgi:hypothetical protein
VAVAYTGAVAPPRTQTRTDGACMKTIVKTFASRQDAIDAAERIRAHIGDDRLTLLLPGMTGRAIEAAVHSEPGEAPGTGAAVGAVVGGAVGLAAASMVVPGVGPVIVAGMLAAGATAGGAVGASLEETLSAGISREELASCLEALRAGRSVVIAEVDGDAEEEAVRRALDDGVSAGAPSAG